MPAPPRAAVAAGHVATVRAALDVLELGGNAFDAAVAAGFAAGVAEPCLSSLGGGGFLMARPVGRPAVLFDFFVDTPGRGVALPTEPPPLEPVTLRFGGADQVFHVGHASVAVPGALPGYLHVHRRLGRLPLAEVVAPAVELAGGGVVLGPDQAAVVRLLEPLFTLSAAARALFVPGHRPFGDDDAVTNPALATFLAAVGSGEVTGFHDPAVVPAIVAGMAEHGGLVTRDDLVGYRVEERRPLSTPVTGGRLITNPAPAFGGGLVAGAVARLAAQGQAGGFGSGPRLRQLAAVLDAITREHRQGGPVASTGTTHVSVIDREGNLAAMTTSNGAGSGIMLGDTGVLANNIMGEADLHPSGFHRSPPGQRVGSMMAPSVLVRADAPAVALGSGGSERIRSALTQVVVNLVEHAMPLVEAVTAPRIHVDDGCVQVEPGFSRAAVDDLAVTWPVNRWTVSDLYFGGVHAVDEGGGAVGDARRGGETGWLP